MKNLFELLLFILLTSCGQKTTEQTVEKQDSVQVVSSQIVDNHKDLFADSCFTYLNLDSLDENMLRDSTEKRDYKYIKSLKRFTKEHCNYFKTGCRGYFVDDHVFLIAKQNSISGITPIIIHDSKDFNYYHSELYTLDKYYNKVDSVTVSLTGSGTQSDEPSIYYIIEISSKFKDNKIITTEIERWRYSKIDSTVTMDSVIVYREIDKDGKIKTLKKDKII